MNIWDVEIHKGYFSPLENLTTCITVMHNYAQGRHCRFLAGKTATIAGISLGLPALPSTLQKLGKTSFLPVLPLMAALNCISTQVL